MARFLGLFPVVGGVFLGFSGGQPTAQAENLTLTEYIGRVVERNEKVQARLLEFEISQKKVGAASAIFEPELFVQAEYLDDRRENTAEQLRNLGGVNEFTQRNLAYSSGIEMLMKTGGRARVGFDVGYLNNNLQNFRGVSREYTSFFGLSVTQPLLKGAGKTATMSAIRVAALESEQAYQEYRRQMMVILAGAELAYWDLYYAQEQRKLYADSLALAEKIDHDTREGFAQGRLDELDALTAETTAEERRAELGQADQAVLEAANQASVFLSLARFEVVAATEPLMEDSGNRSIQDYLEAARGRNPEYRMRLHQVDIERERVRYAKNQRLPQLDLQGRFGTRGLDERAEGSLGELADARFPAWSVGVEFRWPLGGGGKSRNELEAAQLRYQQAMMNLREANTQITHEVDNAQGRVARSRERAVSYRKTVALNRKVLEAEMASREIGKGSSRRVLEAEAKLLLARNEELHSRVEHQRARLALETSSGVILANRGWDMSREEVAARTRALTKGGRVTERQLREFQESVRGMFSASVEKKGQGLLAQGRDLRVQPKVSALRDRDKLDRWASAKRAERERLASKEPARLPAKCFLAGGPTVLLTGMMRTEPECGPSFQLGGTDQCGPSFQLGITPNKGQRPDPYQPGATPQENIASPKLEAWATLICHSPAAGSAPLPVGFARPKSHLAAPKLEAWATLESTFPPSNPARAAFHLWCGRAPPEPSHINTS